MTTRDEIFQLLLERAAADVGMTLEQAIKEAETGRIVLSMKFIVMQPTEQVNGRRPSNINRENRTAIEDDGRPDTKIGGVSL